MKSQKLLHLTLIFQCTEDNVSFLICMSRLKWILLGLMPILFQIYWQRAKFIWSLNKWSYIITILV